jgi:hypothetical protein
MMALVVPVEPLRQNAFVVPFDYFRGQQDRRTCDALTLAKAPSSGDRADGADFFRSVII